MKNCGMFNDVIAVVKIWYLFQFSSGSVDELFHPTFSHFAALLTTTSSVNWVKCFIHRCLSVSPLKWKICIHSEVTKVFEKTISLFFFISSSFCQCMTDDVSYRKKKHEESMLRVACGWVKIPISYYVRDAQTHGKDKIGKCSHSIKIPPHCNL